MRYHGHGGAIAVPWMSGPRGIEAAFTAAHQALYGFVLDTTVEIVTLRFEATGLMPRPPQPELPPGRGAAPRLVRCVGDPADVPVYGRDTLGAGDRFAGPAIVTQLDATTVAPRGWTGLVHPTGAILLTSDAF